LLLAVAALTALAAPARAADVGATTTLRIATADIGEIYKKYARREAEQGEMNAWRVQIEERVKAMDAERQRLQKEIDALALGSPERLERKKKLDDLQQELLAATRGARKELDERVTRVTSELYQEILAIIADYARDNKIDLVLKQQSFTPEEAAIPQGLMMQIGLQTVLYQREGLDITPAIIERLNRRYEETKRAGAEKAGEGAAKLEAPAKKGEGGEAAKPAPKVEATPPQ
jgi:Skp family chaperone for outer membrane proteins